MSGARPAAESAGRTPSAGRTVLMVVAWLWVGIPFAYGLVQLIAKIPALFAV